MQRHLRGRVDALPGPLASRAISSAEGAADPARLLQGSRHAAAATASAALVAGSSLVLQLVAARRLGAAGLGTFGLLTSVLIAFSSLHTGWVGDSLTVLDRFDPPIRRALVRSEATAVVLAVVVGAVSATALGTGVGIASAFGAAVALWALEDTARRLFMARSEYGHLLVNDLAFAAASLGLVVGLVATGRRPTLGWLVAGLAAGGAAACAAALVQLPRHELAPPTGAGAGGLRRVSSFASWRAAQVGVRPLAQLLMRVVVAGVASAASLGRLEAARLVVAPVLVLVNAAGSVLLPRYSRQARSDTLAEAPVRRAALGLVAVVLVWTVLALVGLDRLEPLLTDGAFPVDPAAVVAWGLSAAAFAAGVPVVTATVASRRSRRAFARRSLDASLGLALVGGVVAAGAPELAPAGLALGSAVGTALLLRDLRRHG